MLWRGMVGGIMYSIPGGSSVDRFPLPIGAAYADMQQWAAATSQKGDLDQDDHITPADAAITQNPAADVSGDGASPPSMR